MWRLVFQQLLGSFKTDADSASAFDKLARQRDGGQLVKGLALFLLTKVGPWLTMQSSVKAVAQGATVKASTGSMSHSQVEVLLRRLQAGERLLSSSTAAVLAG